MSEHSVESHLRVDVNEYDIAIRRFVPHYDEMIEITLELVAKLARPEVTVLDLGAGTARLSAALLERLPEVRVIALDIDPKMLDLARARLACHGDRVGFVAGSFGDELPACDVVVASLSLHHVCAMEEKSRIYRSVIERLPPGGLFLIADASVSSDEAIGGATFEGWVGWMVDHGITEADARDHLAAWAKDEKYQPIADELEALRRVGLGTAECFYRRGPTTIYGGLKR